MKSVCITHIRYLSPVFVSQDEGFDVQTIGYGMTCLRTILCTLNLKVTTVPYCISRYVQA